MNSIQDNSTHTKALKFCNVLKLDTWQLPTFCSDTNFFKKEQKQCTVRHALFC